MYFPCSVWALVRLLVATVCLAGCGVGNLDLLPVSGRVFYDGQPLTAGTVSFHLADATGHIPTGAIDAEGCQTE